MELDDEGASDVRGGSKMMVVLVTIMMPMKRPHCA